MDPEEARLMGRISIALGAGMLALVLSAALSRGQEPPEAPAGSGGAPGSGSGGTTVRAEALPGGAPEIGGYRDKVVFVLDRSGSMALADRFAAALDILDQLLIELPKDTKFDIYLATEKELSLFEGNWYSSGDVRKAIRAKIGGAGGLDYGGFTDLVGALKVAAERRRPDAVYLLSDGVATISELETENIIGAVAKVALQVKVPVHTIGIGLGQDLAEDQEQARLVLRGMAEATGGIYREVKCETRPRGRAFVFTPPWAPLDPAERARIHLKTPNGKELRIRQFGGRAGLGDVLIEIEDPALKLGIVAFEYSEPRLTVRTFLANGKLFFETRPIGMRRSGPDRLQSTVAVRIVPPADDSAPDEVTTGNILPVKCPSGGSVEFVYRRGAREFREAAVADVAPAR